MFKGATSNSRAPGLNPGATVCESSEPGNQRLLLVGCWMAARRHMIYSLQRKDGGVEGGCESLEGGWGGRGVGEEEGGGSF